MREYQRTKARFIACGIIVPIELLVGKEAPSGIGIPQ